MKYSLQQNAISSLSIAIENFKKFYYQSDKYSQSKKDEAIKICIIFLENSIELMLKAILASDNPLSIYKYPNSKTVQNALKKVTASCRLEDILISKNKFETISYVDIVNKYNEIYYNKSKKVTEVLTVLGIKRNAVTHFGINETNNFNELIICMLNAFDIIYNYLYPQLIKLNDINNYFTSDDLTVETIHGKNTLFDENFLYNNIIDFLDELMEISKENICAWRASNPKSKIYKFTNIMKQIIDDNKLCQIFTYNNAKIEFETYDLKNNNFWLKIIKNSKLLDVGSCYSPFYNITAFCGESGNVYFLIVHDKDELYIYDQVYDVIWPAYDEAEPEYQWISDYENYICKKYNLSKRNILLAFENIVNCNNW